MSIARQRGLLLGGRGRQPGEAHRVGARIRVERRVRQAVAVGEVVQRSAQPPLDGARQHAAVAEERLAAGLQCLHQPVAHHRAGVAEGDLDERRQRCRR